MRYFPERGTRSALIEGSSNELFGVAA
jgi:hypothetical protein